MWLELMERPGIYVKWMDQQKKELNLVEMTQKFISADVMNQKTVSNGFIRERQIIQYKNWSKR